jgi:DNA polymerase III delta prime subunit
MPLNIHSSIKAKLEYFHAIHKIPNIIFHGASGSGKRTIVNNFINLIYDGNKNKIKDFVMYVNCAHGKGIKFIRDELKFFAKTHINSNGGDIFKSIIMLNADKLTIDAQSALRRCIELFSHNTRFFIIVEDKYKLLKPVLSRFCEIYIPDPIHNGVQINLYKYNIDKIFKNKIAHAQTREWLKKTLIKDAFVDAETNDDVATIEQPLIDAENVIITRQNKLTELSVKLYEKGYSALDIMGLLENHTFLPELNLDKRYELLVVFNKIKKEFRNEKLLIMFILNFIFISSNISLENISFM